MGSRPGVLALTRSKAGLLALLAVLLFPIFAVSVAQAQEPAPISGRIEDVDDSDFPDVRAIVTLLDEAGRPITGLTANDFEAEETGASSQVSDVQTVLDEKLGVAVILVIDTSGSMEGDPIVQAQNAARSFVENLADTDQAAVVSFAESVSVDSALSSDRAQTLAALDGLVVEGNTALYSGVVEAVDQAREAGLPRKAIILLSDGQDFGEASQATRQEALDAAAEVGAPIYSIGLGLDIDRPFLEDLADASGGAFIEAPAPDSIAGIYDQLSQVLRSQYVVTLQSSAPADQQDRSLRIVADTPEGVVELNTDYTSSRTFLAPTPTDEPTLTPTPTIPPPVSSSGTDETKDGSGGGLLLPLVLGIVGVTGITLGVHSYRRSKRRRELEAQMEAMSQRATQELHQGGVGASQGSLATSTRRVSVIGPDGEVTYEIGHEPATIGTSAECQIKLEPAAGVAEKHARCWLREGTLMLHHLAPAYESIVGGTSVTWVSLARDDEVLIGPYRLRVSD